ncbi:PEP-CTERM sorting domain-containing protein [Aquincola sp. S2]|uniref:PEP-CTERM sorting domain-containing protein n=1 Tax=Pseudaquabacterium terrae TaxID=2732868 RepID=A0ABX2EHC9_9BURK|nr:PEP-CTERM sorting domain-containing protein [Aquabacterium terrae]NRF67991.1 PEP-CTERM sorting domain-containing protein [Aquabacterium terrae]
MLTSTIRRCAVAAALACAPLLANAVALSYYQEVGDAGAMPTPQSVTGGPYSGIQGMLGGADEADAFLFYFAGGAIVIEASWDDATTDTLFLELFGDACMSSCGSLGSGSNSLTVTDLAAGNYVLEIATGFAADPPFTIELFDLNQQPLIILPPQAVPSPSTAALLGAALLALGWASRRRRAAD